MRKKSKRNHRAASGSYRLGEFDLAPAERQLSRHGRAIRLSPKLFDALLLFVRNAERLVRRDELVEALWPDTHVTDANLTNLIVGLRKVFGRRAIQTVSKYGYRFLLPVLGEPGIDPAIYARFVRAKELATHRSLQSMAEARDLFALCIAQDPDFAAAWAWMGRCYRFLDKFEGRSTTNLELAQAALRRALAIDPHLASAHHFYTQLQIDLGESRAAAIRLVQRIAASGADAESLAGLVHAFRFTGLLDESVAAHTRAVAIDPALVTSVAHTHFLRCDYPATLESYGQTRYYLDAAAWAALGDRRRAIALLRERVTSQQLSPLMAGLMSSLLAVLEDRREEAEAIMTALAIEREPEVVFYLARHFAMLGNKGIAVRMIQRARTEGLMSSSTLERDDAFALLRGHAGFQREIKDAKVAQRLTLVELERAGIGRVTGPRAQRSGRGV